MFNAYKINFHFRRPPFWAKKPIYSFWPFYTPAQSSTAPCALLTVGEDNGFAPGWHQVIIWTNVGILLIWPLGTNFNKIFNRNSYIFKKIHLKMSPGKMANILSRPQYVKSHRKWSINCMVSICIYIVDWSIEHLYFLFLTSTKATIKYNIFT